MFRPKFLIPVRIGFLTIIRYTFAVGFTTSVIRPRLKAQIPRLNGSNGSGTDFGSTTVSESLAPEFESAAAKTGCAGPNEMNPDMARTNAWPWRIIFAISLGKSLITVPPETSLSRAYGQSYRARLKIVGAEVTRL